MTFALALSAVASKAFGSPSVEVLVATECPVLSGAQIGSLTELDLKDEAHLERVTVHIECQGPVIRVQAHSVPDQADYERTLSAMLLEQTGAERTIAVTVSQMILADRFRLETPPPPVPLRAPAPVAKAPSRAEPTVTPARVEQLVARVQGELEVLRRGATRNVTTTGVGVGASLRLKGLLWFEGHSLYERSEFQRSLGDVSASVIWLRFGPAVVATFGRLELHGALSVSLGQVTLTGHASAGNHDDAVAGVSGAGDACFGPTLALGPVALSARAVAGYALATPTARIRGDVDVSTGGPYFGGLFALGFSFRR